MTSAHHVRDRQETEQALLERVRHASTVEEVECLMSLVAAMPGKSQYNVLHRPMGGRAEEIYNLLKQHEGHFVHRDRLYASLFENDPDPPFDTIIYVHICHLRNYLRRWMPDYEIRTMRSQGFCLIRKGAAHVVR